MACTQGLQSPTGTFEPTLAVTAACPFLPCFSGSLLQAPVQMPRGSSGSFVFLPEVFVCLSFHLY